MKRSIPLALIPVILVGCAPANQSPLITSPRTYEGAAAGAALGAVTGALIDKDKRWRGAVIGGALGALLGGTLTEISARAAREAAMQNQPVVYQSQDGWQKVEAVPVQTVTYDRGDQGQTKCKKVRIRQWDRGHLVKEEIKEICEAEKTEPRYMEGL